MPYHIQISRIATVTLPSFHNKLIVLLFHMPHMLWPLLDLEKALAELFSGKNMAAFSKNLSYLVPVTGGYY